MLLFPLQQLPIGCRVTNSLHSRLSMITSTASGSSDVDCRLINFISDSYWYPFGDSISVDTSYIRVLPTIADVPLQQRALLLLHSDVYYHQFALTIYASLEFKCIGRVESRSACGRTVTVVTEKNKKISVPVELCAPVRVNQECDCV